MLLAWHRDRSQATPFYRETDPIFKRYPEPPRPTPERSVDTTANALRTSPLFTGFGRSSYPWQVRYRARDYLDLPLTYSNVQALGADEQQTLLADVAAVVAQHGGVVERHVESVLLSAARHHKIVPQRDARVLTM